ncbi:hypothetical protein QTP88_007527 [Uroleucon formosanum]
MALRPRGKRRRAGAGCVFLSRPARRLDKMIFRQMTLQKNRWVLYDSVALTSFRGLFGSVSRRKGIALGNREVAVVACGGWGVCMCVYKKCNSEDLLRSKVLFTSSVNELEIVHGRGYIAVVDNERGFGRNV